MLPNDLLIQAYEKMCLARDMTAMYERNRQACKYVHATSRGHEAIQLATAFQLLPTDYVSPYYRDEAMLLGLGFTPYDLMLQLLAKEGDGFSGGRAYYGHPSYRGTGKPTIIHQSSATGMQAIPTTGIAQGLKYREKMAELNKAAVEVDSLRLPLPVVICSLGDASITEGEVSEAFQFAALHQLPIIYLVQDNNWGISVSAAEARTNNAFQFIQGFTGIQSISIDGSDFVESFTYMQSVITEVRKNRCPYLVHARVPLLAHHTSGVRKEFYRTSVDLERHAIDDPQPKLKQVLLQAGISETAISELETQCSLLVEQHFQTALAAPEPEPATATDFVFAPTLVTQEKGVREPQGREKIMMVDAALFAIRELMEAHPEVLLYGQDVGRRLGGVFREAATLAQQFGDHRVFNTAIQEAYIIGSTAGMCAVGLKPIVEVQFADYLYPALNQLVSEIAKSYYLTAGKFPVQTLIRVPIGAYGGGGPYHSGSLETILLSIKGIKVVYPSNAADMKGLFKAAFYDPNPVIMLEHKGLYWSKVPGTENAKRPEPAADYILPLGIASVLQFASTKAITEGDSCCIVTYGMGVYWSVSAAAAFPGRVEIVDLRTLYPLDEKLVYERVTIHGKCLVVTEEAQNNSFAEALAGRISKACFNFLDAAVDVIGALNLPAVPLNIGLEHFMLPNSDKVAVRIKQLLNN